MWGLFSIVSVGYHSLFPPLVVVVLVNFEFLAVFRVVVISVAALPVSEVTLAAAA